MTLLVVLLVVLAFVVASSVGWAVKTAQRLDRLHVRRDLAWQALIAALDRRALVARSVAAALGPDGRELAELAGFVESSDPAWREQLESRLSILLAEVQASKLAPHLVEERADARARVRFARSFYNEAVRDTLALRSRFATRLFRLAGSAKLPAYFEIAEGPEL
jgi:hypothetical protein